MNRTFEVAFCDHHSGQFSLLALPLGTGRTALVAKGWEENTGLNGPEWSRFTWFEFVTDRLVDPSDTGWSVSAKNACVQEIPESLRADSELGCGKALLSESELGELLEQFPNLEFFEP
jgi:hypothetical protein